MKNQKQKRKEYPSYWIDLIGEGFCMARSGSQKVWHGIDWITKEKHDIVNKNYVPITQRKKNCKKELSFGCMGCPFLAVGEPTKGLSNCIKFYYKMMNMTWKIESWWWKIKNFIVKNGWFILFWIVLIGLWLVLYLFCRG